MPVITIEDSGYFWCNGRYRCGEPHYKGLQGIVRHNFCNDCDSYQRGRKTIRVKDNRGITKLDRWSKKGSIGQTKTEN